MTDSTKEALKVAKCLSDGISFNDIRAILRASSQSVSDDALDVIVMAYAKSFKDCYADPYVLEADRLKEE